MTCFMGGMILGPLVGGVALAYFWWGSVFLLAVPVMALLLVRRRALADPGHEPDHRLVPLKKASSAASTSETSGQLG
jgi:DHA2 family multidrug resistance protein-like MFS transporter